ncbi:MAG: hypothetical protein WDA71_13760 [Actinomycetota bacterium]
MRHTFDRRDGNLGARVSSMGGNAVSVWLMCLIIAAAFAGGALFLLLVDRIRDWIRSWVGRGQRPRPAPASSESPDDATRLIRLCDQVDKAFKTMSHEKAAEKQQEIEARIRRIGQTLYDRGGEALMLEICQRVASRSAHGRYLEGAWSGIGTWMG